MASTQGAINRGTRFRSTRSKKTVEVVGQSLTNPDDVVCVAVMREDGGPAEASSRVEMRKSDLLNTAEWKPV